MRSLRARAQSDGQFYSGVWEECRTIGTSWGYHRGLLYEDYQQPAELIGRVRIRRSRCGHARR